MPAAVLTLSVLSYVVGALLATGPRWRRALCFVPACSGAFNPYVLPREWAVARAIDAIVFIGAIVRATDLVFRTEPTPPLRRLFHALSLADSFRLRRAPPAFPSRLVVRVALFAALILVGRGLAFDVAPRISMHACSLAVRWLGGLLYIYSFTEVAYGGLTLAYRAAGFDPPVIHSDPALARSVREFWGKRWNRIVSAWLDARFYRPLARRGHPVVGMMLAFTVSALLHGYVIHPVLGVRWALIVTGYFLLQGVFALIEGPLRVARWPPAAGHAWTIAVMGGTSPLACEAFLRIVGP